MRAILFPLPSSALVFEAIVLPFASAGCGWEVGLAVKVDRIGLMELEVGAGVDASLLCWVRARMEEDIDEALDKMEDDSSFSSAALNVYILERLTGAGAENVSAVGCSQSETPSLVLPQQRQTCCL